MIKSKLNKCKGIGIAKDFKSCGELSDKRNKGLCQKCYRLFIFSGTKAGNEEKEKFFIKNKKRVDRKQIEIKLEDKRNSRKEKSEMNESSSMKLADTYFSRFIRLKHSEEGLCTCYTCGSVLPIKQVDNGHYQKRVHKVVRYNENNCRPQCKKCNGNTLHNGKQVEFRINLINEIGLSEVEVIENSIKENGKYTTSFYKEKADYYRKAVHEIQKKLGVKYW